MPRLRLLTVPTLAALLAGPAIAAETAEAAPGPVRTPPTPLAGTGGDAAQLGAAVGGAVDTALRNLRWGAYGEMHYNNFQGQTTEDMLDLHRLVLMAETQITDRWRFVGEVEIEHAFVDDTVTGSNTGELEVEQAYIEWRYHDDHVVRGGMQLVPISIGNLYHEPTLFHGVERPLIDNIVIPTTWYENGVGAYGRIVEGLDYGVAIQTGLLGTGFEAKNGFRGGRQKGSSAQAEDLMGTARLDYRPMPGLWLAGAVNYGGVDQDEAQDSAVGGAVAEDVHALLYTLEARYADFGFDAGITWAHGMIDEPAAIDAAVIDTLPEAFTGVSVHLAYDVLRLIADTSHQLYAFGRYEDIDMQADIPAAVAENGERHIRVYQYGVTYKPNPWVAIKADYRDVEDDASGTTSATAVDSWNLGVGFAF